MKFYNVTIEMLISGKTNDLWEMLALNFGHIARYSKDLKSSEYRSEHTTGIGTKRYCVMSNNGFMEEEVTQWKELESFGFQITNSSLPLKKGCSLLFTFHPINEEKISIVVEGKYRLKKLGFLSPLLYPKMKQLIHNYLNDIQKAIIK